MFLQNSINKTLWAAALVAAACSNTPHKDDVLAECGGSVLTRAELASHVPDGLSETDSVAFAKQYVEEWVKDAVLEQVAKEEIEDLDERIEHQLRQYERKLARQAFGDWVVATQMDTAVSEDEIYNYYAKYPEKFRSESRQYCYFHVATEQAEQLRIGALMQSREPDKIDELVEWCKNNATEYRLDSSFVDMQEMLRVMQGYYGNAMLVQPNRLETYSQTVDDKNIYHFFKLIQVIDQGNVLPLRAVRNRIRTLLLVQRKAKRIEALELELIQQAKAKGDAKVYIQ